MKNILVIAKKELDKIFKYPRAIFSTIILPGLLIFLVYSFMGDSADSASKKQEKVVHKILLVNPAPTNENVTNYLRDNMEEFKIDVTVYDGLEFDIDDYKGSLNDGKYNAIMVFAPSANYPLKVYSDLSDEENGNLGDKIQEILVSYSLYNQGITLDLFDFEDIIDVNPKASNAMMLSILVPFLIIIFIFSGALSIGADAIAGEKERGTLATILITPVKKSEFIIGKIISTTIIAVLSALSSFIGVFASMANSKAMFGDVNFDYGFSEYFALFAIIIAMSFFALSLILLVSTFAKGVKEATTLSIPFYIIAMLACVIGFFNLDASNQVGVFFIPIYNVNMCLKSILMFNISWTNVFITLISTILYSFIAVAITLRLFKSEKVLFNQ